MMLSEHFSLAEMTRTSQRFANVPNAREILALTTLCVHVLEPIRAHYRRPVSVNSGFRAKLVNDAVGSNDKSQHRKGEAADIEVENIPNITLAEYIRDTLAFDQLILEAYRPGVVGSGWVHVSFRADRFRKSVLTMTMGSHGPVYSQGIKS